MIDLTRRRFLQLSVAAAAVGISVPAFDPRRNPYVSEGQVVDFIGLGMYPEPGFTGGAIVAKVYGWDGVGYPVDMFDQSYRNPLPLQPGKFYDSDLACLRTETPAKFWHDKSNWGRYKNLHAYVREQRYGEDPATYDARRQARRIARQALVEAAA
jgi:hypothetical protein